MNEMFAARARTLYAAINRVAQVTVRASQGDVTQRPRPLAELDEEVIRALIPAAQAVLDNDTGGEGPGPEPGDGLVDYTGPLLFVPRNPVGSTCRIVALESAQLPMDLFQYYMDNLTGVVDGIGSPEVAWEVRASVIYNAITSKNAEFLVPTGTVFPELQYEEIQNFGCPAGAGGRDYAIQVENPTVSWTSWYLFMCESEGGLYPGPVGWRGEGPGDITISPESGVTLSTYFTPTCTRNITCKRYADVPTAAELDVLAAPYFEAEYGPGPWSSIL